MFQPTLVSHCSFCSTGPISSVSGPELRGVGRWQRNFPNSIPPPRDHATSPLLSSGRRAGLVNRPSAFTPPFVQSEILQRALSRRRRRRRARSDGTSRWFHLFLLFLLVARPSESSSLTSSSALPSVADDFVARSPSCVMMIYIFSHSHILVVKLRPGRESE